jgi:Carbohydrate family 9 binding domain-like
MTLKISAVAVCRFAALRRLSRVACLLVVGTLVLLSNAFCQSTAPKSRIAGKQFMVARYTKTPPVIDGVFSLSEWGRAIPVYVEGTSSPATPPGVVPNIGLPYLFPPDSPADSSFKIYALYDDNNLYVAVDVTDDIIICDGPVPYLDDDVEILIDGDRRPGDAHMAVNCGPNNPNCPNPVVNNEGFQLITSVCNQSMTVPSNNPSIIWESMAGLRPHGFVVEFRIPLSSINTIDTSWFSNPFPGSGFRSPQPGDIIGFNVNVGDDDNGGLSYLRTEPAPHTDSATAWDGRSVGWYIFSEADWGNLYLAPRTDNDD